MANFSLTLLLLGMLMCQPWAARKRVKVVARHAPAAGDAGHKAADPYDNVLAFLEAATMLGPQGQAAGTLASMLEQGVRTTMESSSLTMDRESNRGPWTGSAETVKEAFYQKIDGWMSCTLTLEVVHKQVNQGEIATPSKVPVLWTLAKTTKYTFQGNALQVSGIKLLPFAEGREMYIASGVQAKCASISKEVTQPQVVCEREALFKWYAAEYKKGTFTKADYLHFDSSPDHKLGRILQGMYGKSATYNAVRLGAGEGPWSKQTAWSKIVYSLVTIAPIEIEHFEFLGDSENFEEVEVAMKSHATVEGKYGVDLSEEASLTDALDLKEAHDGLDLKPVDLADYDGLNFYEKNGAEFEKEAFESQRAAGERFARSGLNFGAMAVKGKNDDILHSNVRGGTSKYIINFAKPCQELTAKVDKNNDPTDECRGEMGRVFWHLRSFQHQQEK